MINLIKRIFNNPNEGKVILVHFDGKRRDCTATFKGLGWYAAPYLQETQCLLLPAGKLRGQSYIDSWEPISENMIKFYNKEI